jgi:hypothetical protein
MVWAVRAPIQRTRAATEIPARQSIARALRALRCALAESNIAHVRFSLGLITRLTRSLFTIALIARLLDWRATHRSTIRVHIPLTGFPVNLTRT